MSWFAVVLALLGDPADCPPDWTPQDVVVAPYSAVETRPNGTVSGPMTRVSYLIINREK
jgi:hypothetical protein